MPQARFDGAAADARAAGGSGGSDVGGAAGGAGSVDAAPAIDSAAADAKAGPQDVSPPGSDAAAACGAGLPKPDGMQMILANGKMRKLIVRVPAAYDGKRPQPVIFVFHGAGGNATAFDKANNFRRDLGDKAVLVFPEALVFEQTGATTWMRDAPDDLAFFDAMVTWLGQNVCIDRARIFATGHSSGGFFSNTLGCQRGNVVRGIAPVSGGPREMKNCVGAPAAWIAHGDMDTNIVPATGMQARDFWLDRNACKKANPAATTPAPCVAHAGCNAGHPVHWCLFSGGHVWPAFANAGLWDFFSKL